MATGAVAGAVAGAAAGFGLGDFDLADKLRLGFLTVPGPGKASKKESELGSKLKDGKEEDDVDVVVVVVGLTAAGVESQL